MFEIAIAAFAGVAAWLSPQKPEKMRNEPSAAAHWLASDSEMSRMGGQKGRRR